MRSEGAYPLTVHGVLAAMVAGAFAGLLGDDLRAAYAAFVLIATVSIVWRRGDPVVLPFIMCFQWVAVTAGYWYQSWSGIFPGYYPAGDVDRTMTIALTGLLLLACGARLVSQWVGRRAVGADTGDHAQSPGLASIWPLFFAVMVSYAVDYVYTLNPREFGGVASFVQRVLEFRQVLLVTLWFEIIRSRQHGWVLLVSLVWAVMPSLGAYYSDFKSPVVLMLIVMATSWRPWDRRWWPGSVTAAVRAAPLAVGLLILLLMWQGGIKRETRLAHDEGVIGREPGERISFFIQNARAELPALFARPEPYFEALVERVAYITFFSRVLEHVPAREPHADGELLKMALLNAFVPRFLVPEKPALPSDSYYTRRFAGISVAEGQTSISIGYLAEFYADWGLAGMFVSVFVYGCWIGLIAGVVGRFAAVPMLRQGAMIMVLLAVADFEHQFIKGFAALNLNAGVTLALLFVLGPQLKRLVAVAASRVPAPGPAPAGAETP